MANKHIQHVKSNVVNTDAQGNKSPKLPTTGQLLYGEIGINYANGYERMSIKNDDNEIVEFVSKEYVVGKNEIDNVVSTAIQQAITADPPTADQEALIKAISDAVGGVTDVAYDTTNKKITKTVGSTTSDVVTAATLKSDMGLDNVGNFKAVSTVANQGLSSTEQENARANIGAGTSSLEIGTTATTAAAGNHTHGNISNDGKLTDTAAAAAGNDYLVIRNADNSNIQTSTIKGTDVKDAVDKKHSHSNQSVLDGITSENITSWNSAASSGVTNVGYNATTKEITQTIGSSTTTVVNLSTLKEDLSLTKSDVGLSNVTNVAQIPADEKGAANGVAELDANGKVPSSQLPSYVDDVIEGYYYNSKFYKEAAHTTLITGESDKIYVDLSTDTTYRCSNVTNQTYTQIKGDLALGETETTAYRGDRGKIAYDHSQEAHAPANATVTSASTTNGNIKINGTDTTVYTHPSFTATAAAAKKVGMNDQGHVVLGDSLTKSDVGLGDVGNFKAVSTVANQGLSTTEQENARANIGVPTVNDAKFSIKGAGTEVASTTANASTASSVDIVAGSNVTVTPDAANSKITIAVTDTTYTFDGTYNASTNKAATVSTVTNAINALDGGTIGTGGNGKTITSLSQTNGNVSATFGDISITKSQVSDLGTIGDAAAKSVDTTISAGSTSVNVPTSSAVASFVENKGYVTDNTTYVFAEGSTNGAFSVTPSGGTEQSVSIHGLGTAAYADTSSFLAVNGKADSATVADSANSVALANVSDANDLKAIEALTGTSGLLKKTAANTWVLDTTAYTTNTGTVTSVGITVPTGLAVTGSPITTSGTLAIALTTGYVIPQQTTLDSFLKGTIAVVQVTANVNSYSAGTIATGTQKHVIFSNGGSADYIVTIPTTYKTPDGQAIELTVPHGGYAEANFMNIGGTIYVRGI